MEKLFFEIFLAGWAGGGCCAAGHILSERSRITLSLLIVTCTLVLFSQPIFAVNAVRDAVPL
jgi:hypothetical protein